MSYVWVIIVTTITAGHLTANPVPALAYNDKKACEEYLTAKKVQYPGDYRDGTTVANCMRAPIQMVQ